MFKPFARDLVGAALLLSLFSTSAARSQDSFQERLSSARLGYVEPGTYLAGDKVGFAVDAQGDHYLLRFNGSSEVFVLYPDSASLGGRVLKYDSGETALQVAGWGGVTLYTDDDPDGLPAVRTGDSVLPVPEVASVARVEDAAQDSAEHLADVNRINLAFSADWNALAASAPACAVALDAMENTTRGLDRFGKNARGRDALARRVSAVMLSIAGRPAVGLSGKTLVVTVDPSRGYEGRASSRAITRALGALLSVPQKQS